MYAMKHAYNKCEAGGKKGRLRDPGNLCGTKALCAYFHPSGFSAAYINLDASQIDEPAPSGVTVRVADCVAGAWSSAAVITKSGHCIPSSKKQCNSAMKTT